MVCDRTYIVFRKETDMPEITQKITKEIAVLGDNGKGYTKEINCVEWNGAEAKLDIRSWNSDHTRCSKGITLSDEEAKVLLEALTGYFK